MIDQKKFNIICTANNKIAVCFIEAFTSAFQTKYKAMPISIYKVVHTGPNNQLGGCQDGLFNAAYQLGISDAVKLPPIKPMARGMAMAMINLIVLFMGEVTIQAFKSLMVERSI